MLSNTGHKIKSRKSPNDKIYTPKQVALTMIEMCNIQPNEKVLDPSKGEGVFYDNLPDYCIKSYCEIDDNIDFFDCDERFDLIIGNPPYSLWTRWVDHTMKLTDKFCYIFGFLNLSDIRIKYILDNGYGVAKMHLFKVDWWFGNSFVVLFEKNTPSILTVHPTRVLCDVCNGRCKQGRNGNLPNECTA